MTHAEFTAEFTKTKQSFADHVFVVAADVQSEATYQASLELVAEIDYNLTTGSGHYYDSLGERLTTLEEVVRAILGNDLIMGA